MSRSKFVWLIVFEDGETQFFKAQTISQIMDCGKLYDIDGIISVTRMELANSYSFEDAIDLPFRD